MELKDLFNIRYGQKIYHSKNHLDNKENGTPLISSKGNSRGIYGYFDIKFKYKNVISVPSTGTICMAYYQEEECCIDDNCLVLTPKKDFSKEEMIYFSLIIRKERFKYMYGRQVTPKRLGNMKIRKTDWIGKKRNIAYDDINQSISKEHMSLKNKKWKLFKIKELFEIKKGERITKEKRTNGKIPLITATSENNGVVEFINLKDFEESKKIFNDKITIDMFFNVFYHQYKYFSDDNVHTLIPKFSDNNKYISLFLVSILSKLKVKYDYGRQVRLVRLNSESISLPINEEDSPDWKFMEDYIKSLSYSKSL